MCQWPKKKTRRRNRGKEELQELDDDLLFADDPVEEVNSADFESLAIILFIDLAGGYLSKGLDLKDSWHS